MSINLSQTKNNYYRVRFRVSKNLYPYFKKAYINKSFTTKDKRIAQIQANKLIEAYKHIQQSLYFTTQEQTQILVDKFIKEQLQQDIVMNFVIDDTKYVAVNNKITVKEAYSRFCKWYKQQKITDKQYQLTTNKLSRIILPCFDLSSFIDDITLDSIEEFQELLVGFPNINLKQYRNLTYKELVNLSNIPTSDLITISTQVKYIKVVKQFFNYLVKADIIRYNPCTLVTMPDNTINKREPFSCNEIKQLFKILDTLDDRKYIYYTLAYTGIRPSELWKASFSNDNGIKCIDLTDKAVRLKTSSSYRKIPLHKDLLKMNVDKKLPTILKKYNQYSISNYFNKTIKPTITSNTSKIMYSFRHTVATELKRAEVNMDKVSEILGHTYESNSMTKEVYAGKFSLEQLQEAINQLDYKL